MDEQQYFVIEDPCNIDVLDENLYCYDNVVFTLTPAIQKGASDTDYYEKNLSVRCTFEIMYQDIHIKLRTQVEPVTT